MNEVKSKYRLFPAYLEGCAAFTKGSRREKNPYADQVLKQVDFLAWQAGWDFEEGCQFDPITLEIDTEKIFDFEDQYHNGEIRVKYYYRTPEAREQKNMWLMRRRSNRRKNQERDEEERRKREED